MSPFLASPAHNPLTPPSSTTHHSNTGAIVGGLVMAVLSNGMQLMGVGASTQQIVKGIVLLLAVAFDIYNKRRVGQGS